MADTLSLFLTAASPVLQALLLGVAGAAMAWQGSLNPAGCSVLASLCFYMFTPALTFTTLASSVTIASISKFWPLLINMAFSSILGLMIGWIAARGLRTPIKYRNLVICAIGFGNVGNLPLVFVGALCSDPTAIFQKTLGEDCDRLGIAYTAFDICVATLFQFTLAIYLLRPRDEESQNNVNHLDGIKIGEEEEEEEGAEKESLLLHHFDNSNAGIHKDPTVSDLLRGNKSSSRSGSSSNASGSPISINLRRPEEVEIELVTADNAYRHMQEEDRATTLPPPPPLENNKLIAWLRSVDWKSAFPLPSQAAFGGVLVGCTPIRNLFFGADPLLRPLSEALKLLGDGLIPAAIPLLGAVLYRGPGKSQIPTRVTVGVVLTRLVLQPAVFTLLVVLALHFKFFTAPDPMFLLTLLLANATPTAINMQTLTVLYNFGQMEMSAFLFSEYLFSLITLPAFLWIFLKAIQAYVPSS